MGDERNTVGDARTGFDPTSDDELGEKLRWIYSRYGNDLSAFFRDAIEDAKRRAGAKKPGRVELERAVVSAAREWREATRRVEDSLTKGRVEIQEAGAAYWRATVALREAVDALGEGG